jgi:hypothetical protein
MTGGLHLLLSISLPVMMPLCKPSEKADMGWQFGDPTAQSSRAGDRNLSTLSIYRTQFDDGSHD